MTTEANPLFRFLRVAAAAALTCALLAACQPASERPALSLEQAREATASFTGSFTPPPKGAREILASFDLIPGPPTYGCGAVVSLTDEEISEMVEAMPPNRLGAFHRGKFFTGLARTLIFQGNYPRGVKMMRWAIDDVPDQLRGGRSRYQALLGLFQAYAGDFDTAETNVDRASSNLVQSYKHLSGTS